MQTDARMQRAVLLSIGTELSLGQTVDTNAAWLAARLAEIGIRATRHVTIPDELSDIEAELRSLAGAEVTLITGGLGPTEDDLTRQALARVAGAPLELDRESLANMQAYFDARQRPMHEANRVQALLPRGGRALRNTCGTAPGIFIRLDRTPCYAMPGVPSEMRAMFTQFVLPELRAAAAGRVLVCRRLNCFGAGESAIGAKIKDLMARGQNPEVGTTAQGGVVGIRINATAESTAAAESLIAQMQTELSDRLGELVFGRDDETLAMAAGMLLSKRRETVALAESCTGGLLGKLITDVSGASCYFPGGVVCYANEVKQDWLGVPMDELAAHGAVSEAVARRLAGAVRERMNATYGIAVTGIAGPTGGSAEKPVGLVFIGIASPAGVQAERFLFGADMSREDIRNRAAATALNQLRLLLLRNAVR